MRKKDGTRKERKSMRAECVRHADGKKTGERIWVRFWVLLELHSFLPLLFNIMITMIRVVGIFPAGTPDWVFVVTSDMIHRGR